MSEPRRAKFAVLSIASASSKTTVRRASKHDTVSDKLNASSSASKPSAADCQGC
jgi:hypothetical protein